MSKKDSNPSKQTKQSSSRQDHSLEYEDSTMPEDSVLTEDPEFPAFISKSNDSSSLYRDVERKKSEMKNSTMGGF